MSNMSSTARVQEPHYNDHANTRRAAQSSGESALASNARPVRTVKDKFAWHRIVARCGKFRPAMIVALMGFFDRYNLTNGCWPSHETIAAEYGVSVRTSKQAVKIAREAGLIQSKRRYCASSVWTLTIPANLEHLAELRTESNEGASGCTSTPDEDEDAENQSAVQCTSTSGDDTGEQSESAAHCTLKVKVQNPAELKCSPLPPNSEDNNISIGGMRKHPPTESIDREDIGDTMLFEKLLRRYPQDYLGDDIDEARFAFALARDAINDDAYLLAQVDNVLYRVYLGDTSVPVLADWLRGLKPLPPVEDY